MRAQRANGRPPVGARVGAPTSLVREMAAFDALPPRLRGLLAGGPFKLLAEPIQQALNGPALAPYPSEVRTMVAEIAYRREVAEMLTLAERERSGS